MKGKNILRSTYRLSKHINWDNRNACLDKIVEQQMSGLDCIIELHDARIPNSGRNREFLNYVENNNLQHLLVLNKSDLLTSSHMKSITSLATHNNDVLLTSCKLNEFSAVDFIMPYLQSRALKSWKNIYKIMICGIPNVGKRTLIDMFFKKRKTLGDPLQPYIKVSESPTIYLLGKPGVLEPHISSDDIGLRLALVGSLPQEKVGIEVLADYLLYFLNKHNHLQYVKRLNCKKPVNTLKELLQHLSETERLYCKVNQAYGGSRMMPDTQAALKRFIQLFRVGELGNICLDAD